jgi:hypothetical protein
MEPVFVFMLDGYVTGTSAVDLPVTVKVELT